MTRRALLAWLRRLPADTPFLVIVAEAERTHWRSCFRTDDDLGRLGAALEMVADKARDLGGSETVH